MKDKIITKKLQEALTDSQATTKAKADFVGTFTDLGQKPVEAGRLADFIFQNLAGVTSETLATREMVIGEMIKRCQCGGRPMPQVLTEKIESRSRIIYEQIKPFLEGVKGLVIDFGCGNGIVAQLLHDGIGLDIEGYDVVKYSSPDITIPTQLFDGATVRVVNRTFEAAVVTNVLHHEENNEQILLELTRIVRRRLVIIETVPDLVPVTEMNSELCRVFWNDYLYNRLFCPGAGIPVPGTYDTPQGWEERLKTLGWILVQSTDLGVDQPIIRDRHHLLVFDR